MPLITYPSVMNWLTPYPNELAGYQLGEAPFGILCFSQASLNRLTLLLDRLARNDEYHRGKRLYYANKGERQAARNEMKRLLDEKHIKKAGIIVKNLNADLTLQAASEYAKLSQPLQLTGWWQESSRQVLSPEGETINALQQKWQVILPFAFCTSHDLLEKVSLLEEIDIYLWLATYYYNSTKTHMPTDFCKSYQEWLLQFSQEVMQVKRILVDAMLGILHAVDATKDLTCDTMINDVIPALKQLKILNPETNGLNLSGSLNASQFKGLVTYIQTQGSHEQQQALGNLSLFESRITDKIPLVTVSTLSGHFISVPRILREYIAPAIPNFWDWLPSPLRLDRRRQEQCFDMGTTYHLMVLNQQLQRIDEWITLPKGRSLTSQVNTLQEILDVEKELHNEVKRTRILKPWGIKAWFFGSTCQMMDAWAAHLQQQRLTLFMQKLTLAEQMVQTLKDTLSETRMTLTTDLFKSVQCLFEELPKQLSTLSKTGISDEVRKRFQKAQENYQITAQFSQHFLKAVLQPDTFYLTRHPLAHWTVIEFDRQQVHEWVEAYKALVSREEALAMELIGQIITGESYPSAYAIKEILRPLFTRHINYEASLQHFIESFLARMIVPCIKSIQDPAYQFVQSLAPALALQWTIDHRTYLDSAIRVVQYVMNVEAGSEIPLDATHPTLLIQGETVTLTENKVIESIELVCALSCHDDDHTSALSIAAKHYLENGSQHTGYHGDNLTYHRIISAIALASGNDSLITGYGSRRFRYLLAQHRYETIHQDPFLEEHRNNLRLKQTIQSELDSVLSEPLDDKFIGLLPVIQQWGCTAQAERYCEQRDQYYLKQLKQILLEPSSVTVIEDFLQRLKRLPEPFPQSGSIGHYELQALLCGSSDETWQVSKQHVVAKLGDRMSQQSYRFTWLKTLLLHPHLSGSCIENLDFHLSYEGWLELLGDNHVASVHALIKHFLDHYDHSHPLGLEVVKNILSAEWITKHNAKDLANKLSTIEQVCQKQMQLKELADDIQKRLTNKDYKTVATQFKFLSKQEAYCKEKDTDRYYSCQEAYQTALTTLTDWLRQAVFTASTETFTWVEVIILPELPDDETKTDLFNLCQSAGSNRFAYERIYSGLCEITFSLNAEKLSFEASHLNYLTSWPPEKRHELANKIDNILSQLTEEHFLYASLLALKRLLLGTSTDEKADRELLVHNMQQTTASQNYLTLKDKLEEKYLALLHTIKSDKPWDRDELTELTHYSRVVSLSPKPQLFAQALEDTLTHVLKRVLTRLATTTKWVKSSPELQQHAQRVIDDCVLIRALANAEDIQLLDKALDQWLFAYCRLFVPKPSHSKLQQVMNAAATYEEVLNLSGNASHQSQIASLKELRTHQDMSGLTQACTLILQKKATNAKTTSKCTQDMPFFSTMNRTLCGVVTSPSQLTSTVQELPNNNLDNSRKENVSVFQR
jgi:hypothetical protein